MTSSTISGECGFGDYTADASSIAWHTSPDWYNDIKFGIFIHWGVYSAPAYGSVAPYESYAEWYWNTMHNPNDHTQTYQYHEATYGTNFNYDDFFSNFTASKFDAKSWVDLVAAAGAQYIVPVTKHHDGFALFDFPSSISNRSSVQYGPKRDFINEILTAAKTYQRRGTYFSLPEWYNPAYKTYAMGSFPGGIYNTELMWCDIGGANNATIFASNWLNWARDQGRQVAFNNRCGLVGDFDTPEYTTNSATVARKWESTRGMDPLSFGYNYQTPDSQYLNANGIVQALVDIVSKNGNFLLDIGPRNDGTIADVMVQGLTEAGYWINAHSESIFKTRYWSVTPGLGSFQYTTTQDAFYIHYLTTPGTTVEIPDIVPYLLGDTVTVVGGSLHGSPVTVTERGDGTISLGLSSAQITADQYVWTFKLAYTTTNAKLS
ncbi:glycoside hydrolase family 29 protein [Oidiodendron maius Zn]|uniref:alpha-L-fucosidase n=1 Tax=Oidiodendron maius (strain Zn) TaxID=913774 RepID=A0A0C3GCC7_OIDMZ|nr:glycoside hydrolase family 29 protein [Oidiodendron maius Zn]